MNTSKIKIEWIVILIGIIATLPFLTLSFYNHPTGDDYGMTNLAKMWGFWGSQVHWYYEWKCAFVNTMLMSVNPLVVNWFFGYKVIPFVFILIFIFVFYMFINALTGNYLRASQKWAIVFGFFTAYLYCVPSVWEAFYWMTSITSYQVSTMLSIIFLIILFKFQHTNGLKNKFVFFLAILVVLIMQGAESYMVFMAAFIPILAVLGIIHTKRFNNLFIVLFIAAAATAIFVLTCPGIYARAKAFPAYVSPETEGIFGHFARAIQGSFTGAMSFLWGKSLTLFLFSIILLSIYEKILAENKQHNRLNIPILNPVIAFLLMLILPMIFLFPACWMSGGLMPYAGRVTNSAFFIFLLGCMYWLFCTWAFVRKKYTAVDLLTSKRIQWIAAFLIVVTFLFPNNIRAAFGDLLTGRASDFNTALNQRYKIIEKCQSDTCFVPPITMHPASIWFTDMTDSITGEENTRYGFYFGKKALLIPKKTGKNTGEIKSRKS